MLTHMAGENDQQNCIPFAKQIAKIFHVGVDTVESMLPPGGVLVVETIGVTL